MKRLFLNFETLPDIEGARKLYALPASLPDKDTAKVLFHHHVQELGRDARFLSPWQSRIAQAALLTMQDETVKFSSWQVESGDEKLLLQRLSESIAGSDMTFCWDEGRGINPLLHVRCMIHGIQLPDKHVRTVERRMRIQPGSVGLSVMARRFGIAAEDMPGDEPTWKLVHNDGEAAVTERCRVNLVASAMLGLKHLYTTGEIDEDLFSSLHARCEAL